MYVSCHRHFFLVRLLNQRWSLPLRLQPSHCNTFRIMCDVPSIAVFCSESIEWFPGIVSKFFFIIIIIIIITITTTIILLTGCWISKQKKEEYKWIIITEMRGEGTEYSWYFFCAMPLSYLDIWELGNVCSYTMKINEPYRLLNWYLFCVVNIVPGTDIKDRLQHTKKTRTSGRATPM